MKHYLLQLLCLGLSLTLFAQSTSTNERGLDKLQNYKLQEVRTTSKDEVSLFGTLIMPKSEFNTVLVIVSGTGRISQKAHNYLTEYLLDHQIAVFKFDKRGVGQSSGTYNDQPQVYTQDFENLYKAFKNLEAVKGKNIGWLGHSLGGLVTMEAIADGFLPDFLIQWSAPIGKPREVLKYQIQNGIKNYDKLIIGDTTEARLATLDFVFELIDTHPDKDAVALWKLAKKEAKKAGQNKKAFANYITAHQLSFARIDQTAFYKKIDIPTLVILGTKDIMVDPVDSEQKIKAFQNPNIDFKTITGMNHFMTVPGTDYKSNAIYDVDSRFKSSLINWIQGL